MTRTPTIDEPEARAPIDARPRNEGPTPLTLAVRVPGSPLCVAIVDLPLAAAPTVVCRCGGCHAALADAATDYL